MHFTKEFIDHLFRKRAAHDVIVTLHLRLSYDADYDQFTFSVEKDPHFTLISKGNVEENDTLVDTLNKLPKTIKLMPDKTWEAL